MWRGETIYSMEIHLFNRLGQFSTLRLPFERVDSTVGGTIDRSVSGSEGVPVAERAGPKCGCDAGRWRLRWTASRGEWREKGTHVILSSSSSNRARNVLLGLHLDSRP
jgi:hypothetical protein